MKGGGGGVEPIPKTEEKLCASLNIYVRNLFKSRSFYEEKKLAGSLTTFWNMLDFLYLKIFTVDFLHQPVEKKKTNQQSQNEG